MKQTKTKKQTKSTAKKPKTGAIRFFAALAAVLLLFGVGFFGVSARLNDTEFIEDEYTRLGTDQEMGMTIPDLSYATKALFDYMRGNRADIRVSVRMNGEDVDDLFYHPKEVIHMEEVRALWSTLTVMAVLSIAIALGLLVGIIFFGKKNTRLRAIGTGLLIGTLVFTGVILAAGLWAIGDFNSFWTVFHFIIFPSSLIDFLSGGMTLEAYNSLNWVFGMDYAMIRMLDELFLPLVLRAGIIFAVEIVALLGVGLICYFRGKRLDQAGSDLVEVRVVEEEERFVPVEDAPDLVLQHRLQNASLEQTKKLMEELRKTPEELEQEALEKTTEPEPINEPAEESEEGFPAAPKPEAAETQKSARKQSVPFADFEPIDLTLKTEPEEEDEAPEHDLF